MGAGVDLFCNVPRELIGGEGESPETEGIIAPIGVKWSKSTVKLYSELLTRTVLVALLAPVQRIKLSARASRR